MMNGIIKATKRFWMDFLEKKNPKKSDFLLLGDSDTGDSFVVTIGTILNMIKDVAQGAIGGHSHKEYARIDGDETITGRWEFSKLLHLLKGFRTSDFVPGMLGVGSSVRKEGDRWVFDIDELRVRKSMHVLELLIQKMRHQGGQQVFSPASGTIRSVEELPEVFRCYIETNESLLSNEFIVGDLVRYQTYSADIRYYWATVVLVGSDFVDLSKTQCDGVLDPIKGDQLCLFGSSDPTRQSLIVISSIGPQSPSIEFYDRVNSFSLEGKRVAMFGKGEDGRMTVIVERGEFRGVTIGGGSKFPVLEDKIDNLPYVGRNLIRNSTHYTDLTHWYTFDYMLQAEGHSVSIRNDIWSGFEPAINLHALSITEGAFGVRQDFDVVDGNRYILSLYLAVHRSVVQVLIKGADHSIVEARGYDYFIEGGEELNKWEKVQIPFVATGRKMILSIDMIKSEQVDCYSWFKLVKLEQGDRSTEWSPAYEDTEEGIANAKRAGETAQQEVLGLNHYVDGVFRDGVIDSAEAVAIEKYINQVNDSFAQLDSTFSDVYNNPNLAHQEIKNQLYACHNSLIGSKSALINTINNAIADGKTTQQEKTAVDSAYLDYRNAAEQYQLMVEQAHRAISDQLKRHSDSAQSVANEAKGEASNASAAAGAAQSAISAMNNDTVFDMVEKKTTRTMWEKISGVASTSSNHGTNGSYFKALTEISKVSSLDSYRSALNLAYNALSANLNTNGLYVNSNKTGFDRQTMAKAFANYGNAEVACYNAIQEHYTSIAQQTANTATVPAVVVETSVDQVLRGEDFTPSTLSARRVLKVGDRKEVLDKERLLLPYSAEWTCSGWSSEQPLIVDNDVCFKAINGWQTTSRNLGKNVKRLFVSFQMAKAWNPAYKYFLSKISDYPNENQRIEITPTTEHPNFMAFSDVLDWDSNAFGILIQGHDAAGQRHELYLRNLVVLDYSDVIDFSGRNYLNLSNSFSGGYGGYGLQVSKNEDAYLVVVSSSGNENYVGGFLNSSNKFDQLGFVSGDKVTAILWIKTTANRLPSFYFNQTTGYVPLIGECSSTEFKPCYCTIRYSKYESGEKNYHLGFNYYGTVVGTTTIKAIKIIKGEYTPQDWQPAPEDAMLKLNGADYSPNTPITIANNPKDNYLFVAEWNGAMTSKNVAVMSSQQAYDLAQQAKNKADSHQYLSDVITSGGTNIEGGLVLGNMLGVKKNNTKAITGAIVGDKNNSGLPFLFGGAPHTRKDGSIDDDNSELAERAKNALFNLYKNSTGRIGNLEFFIYPVTGRPRMQAISSDNSYIILDPNVPAQNDSLAKLNSAIVPETDITSMYEVDFDDYSQRFKKKIADLTQVGGEFTKSSYNTTVSLVSIKTNSMEYDDEWSSFQFFICYIPMLGDYYELDDPILNSVKQDMINFFKEGTSTIYLGDGSATTVNNRDYIMSNVGFHWGVRLMAGTYLGLYATLSLDLTKGISLTVVNNRIYAPAAIVQFNDSAERYFDFQNMKDLILYRYACKYEIETTQPNWQRPQHNAVLTTRYAGFSYEYTTNLKGFLIAKNGVLIRENDDKLFRVFMEKGNVNVEYKGYIYPQSNIPHLICAGRVSMGETQSAIVAGHGFTLSRIQAGRVRITHNYGSVYYIPMVSKEHTISSWDNNVMVADVGSNSFDVISFSTASSEVFEDCIFSFQMIGGYAYGT